MTVSAIVDKVRTYEGTRAGWLRARASALLAALERRGLPFEWALTLVGSVLAHWYRETGAGRSEWNYNVANAKATSWNGAAIYLTNVHDGQELYRAYPSLREGVEDYLAKLEGTRYRGSWLYLLQTGDGRGFYERLMHAGWHPYSEAAMREYDSIVRAIGGPWSPAW